MPLLKTCSTEIGIVPALTFANWSVDACDRRHNCQGRMQLSEVACLGLVPPLSNAFVWFDKSPSSMLESDGP